MKKAKKAQSTDINQFVATKLKELRGDMRPGDFAAKSGVQQELLRKWEEGQQPSLSKLESVAKRNQVGVDYFFPSGQIPQDYPQFSGEVA